MQPSLKFEMSKIIERIATLIAVIFPIFTLLSIANARDNIHRIVYLLGLPLWYKNINYPLTRENYKQQIPYVLLNIIWLIHFFLIVCADLHIKEIWSTFKTAYIDVTSYFSVIASNTNSQRISYNIIKLCVLSCLVLLIGYYNIYKIIDYSDVSRLCKKKKTIKLI